MFSQSAHKLSAFVVLILGLFMFGIMPNVAGVNNLYSTEKEIEETEEEEDKLEIAQHKLGHIVAKGKNIPLYDFYTVVKDKLLAVWKETYDIFLIL